MLRWKIWENVAKRIFVKVFEMCLTKAMGIAGVMRSY